MKLVRRILVVLLIALVIIQFIPGLPENYDENPDTNFVHIYNPPSEVSAIIKTSCYDCHSNTSTWPWYANIAPVSFWIGDHVDHGREHLNFSEWGSYEPKKLDHKLEEIIEEVDEGEMPLTSYTIMHGDAKLSSEQRGLLVNYIKKLRKELGGPASHGEHDHDD